MLSRSTVSPASTRIPGLCCKMSTDLDKMQLERKIRLLTLSSLGFKNIGQDLPYATIASALQVDPSEVEKWVIDGRIDSFAMFYLFVTLTIKLQLSAPASSQANSLKRHKLCT
jgi:hypothetical protein